MNKNFAHDVSATTLENAMLALGSGIPSVGGGKEYAINGGFDSDTGWSKEGAWTITGGKAVTTSNGNTNTIYQTGATTDLVIGRTYVMKFTISDYSEGGVQPRVGNVYSYTLFNSDGDKSIEITPTNVDDNAVGLVCIGGSTTLKVDNFSFHEKSAGTNVNSGVYKINDVTNMTKAGQWNVQTNTFDRENQITTTANQPNIASPIIRSGRMILNGNFAGMYDFAYHEGDLDCDATINTIASRADSQLFTGNMDTHWALIYINGDLKIDINAHS